MLHAKNLQLFLYRLLYACIMAIIIGTILIERGGGSSMNYFSLCRFNFKKYDCYSNLCARSNDF